MGLCLAIADTDTDIDLTIYTQAVKDWKNPGWMDAVWGSFGICPNGYEPVINYWHGTKPGNYTNHGVKVADDNYGYKIPPLNPVSQSEYTTGLLSTLCLSRADSDTAYKNAKITKMNSNGNFKCPSGQSPCSTNSDLGGYTICMDDTSRCPITDLEILNVDSTSSKLSDPDYTSV